MHKQVIEFWFSDIAPEQWWQKDAQFDAMIKARFGALHKQAHAGELEQWRETAQGSLAEVLILDQFSRNIYRDQPESFASDPLALALAQFAISKGFDKQLSEIQRCFLYMPYMHSESQLIHNQAVALFRATGNEKNLGFELKHKEIIDRFGRYPHRNSILGRESTEEELHFLQQPGSGF